MSKSIYPVSVVSSGKNKKERKTVMNNYEVVEVFEFGDAGEIIQTPKFVVLDEIGGDQGPERQSLEDE